MPFMVLQAVKITSYKLYMVIYGNKPYLISIGQICVELPRILATISYNISHNKHRLTNCIIRYLHNNYVVQPIASPFFVV